MNNYFKFPSTPHLRLPFNTNIRNDKMLSLCEIEELLLNELIIEEKIDGANLGISFDSGGNLRLQNRGNYLSPPFNGQWHSLNQWLMPHVDSLFDILSNKLILYGEWCYARHSIYYSKLPDWFIGFDVFDIAERKFYSVARRNELLNNLHLSIVPCIDKGYYTLNELENMCFKSEFSDDVFEGIYIRYDVGDWLEKRAKLVRSNFSQSIETHWKKYGIQPNKINYQ